MTCRCSSWSEGFDLSFPSDLAAMVSKGSKSSSLSSRAPSAESSTVHVERTLERGWRAVVQAGGAERLEAIDTLLWTWKEESFLAHGTSRDGNAEHQPVYLTVDETNPNGAAVRFLVDGASLERFDGYLRVVILFDGHDGTAIATARRQWTYVKAAGLSATYWQETSSGRWEKRA